MDFISHELFSLFFLFFSSLTIEVNVFFFFQIESHPTVENINDNLPHQPWSIFFIQFFFSSKICKLLVAFFKKTNHDFSIPSPSIN